ncbi:MAG TPA: ATP-binding protein [Candidatus Limnocylindrales bacterium]|nr:ATP-binding protein [Candidatus Limnocylindrales bacterium]
MPCKIEINCYFTGMIKRMVLDLVGKRLAQFPSVALIGPRQSGKTTLAKSLTRQYFDLEQPSERLRLDLGWHDLIERDDLLVLDEAQAWPDVFPRLRAAIDARRKKNGRFLLLGSVSPALMRQVSESLAGRMALVELTPFYLAELPRTDPDLLWRCGGYPDGGVLGNKTFPQWQASYLSLMAQRDLPAWGLPAKPAMTDRLFRMMAAQQGGILNASQLGQNLGISYHTVQTYLDHLEAAFLVRRLPPFHANIRKRLVKAPKIYWRDSGLLHALLGHAPGADLWAQPWVGASWEGWVIEQILAARQARGETIEACYFRTQDGLEADLLLQSDKQREVIEIKLTTAPAPEDFARLEKVAALTKATRQVLISRTRRSVAEGNRWSVDLAGYLKAA